MPWRIFSAKVCKKLKIKELKRIKGRNSIEHKMGNIRNRVCRDVSINKN